MATKNEIKDYINTNFDSTSSTYGQDIYNAAQGFGVSASQVDDAMGWGSQAQSWVNNNVTPTYSSPTAGVSGGPTGLLSGSNTNAWQPPPVINPNNNANNPASAAYNPNYVPPSGGDNTSGGGYAVEIMPYYPGTTDNTGPPPVPVNVNDDANVNPAGESYAEANVNGSGPGSEGWSPVGWDPLRGTIVEGPPIPGSISVNDDDGVATYTPTNYNATTEDVDPRALLKNQITEWMDPDSPLNKRMRTTTRQLFNDSGTASTTMMHQALFDAMVKNAMEGGQFDASQISNRSDINLGYLNDADKTNAAFGNEASQFNASQVNALNLQDKAAMDALRLASLNNADKMTMIGLEGSIQSAMNDATLASNQLVASMNNDASITSAQLGLQGQLGVAGINAGSATDVAGLDNASAEEIAQIKADSAANVASLQGALEIQNTELSKSWDHLITISEQAYGIDLQIIKSDTDLIKQGLQNDQAALTAFNTGLYSIYSEGINSGSDGEVVWNAIKDYTTMFKGNMSFNASIGVDTGAGISNETTNAPEDSVDAPDAEDDGDGNATGTGTSVNGGNGSDYDNKMLADGYTKVTLGPDAYGSPRWMWQRDDPNSDGDMETVIVTS